MDIIEFISRDSFTDGDPIELSGWLVDTTKGLFVLGDHLPEDISYPVRAKVTNGDVIYPILRAVPSLAGGWSLLFYRTRLRGVIVGPAPWSVRAQEISIEIDRDSGKYTPVDIRPEIVAEFVRRYGEYNFNLSPDPTRDWMQKY